MVEIEHVVDPTTRESSKEILNIVKDNLLHVYLSIFQCSSIKISRDTTNRDDGKTPIEDANLSSKVLSIPPKISKELLNDDMKLVKEILTQHIKSLDLEKQKKIISVINTRLGSIDYNAKLTEYKQLSFLRKLFLSEPKNTSANKVENIDDACSFLTNEENYESGIIDENTRLQINASQNRDEFIRMVLSNINNIYNSKITVIEIRTILAELLLSQSDLDLEQVAQLQKLSVRPIVYALERKDFGDLDLPEMSDDVNSIMLFEFVNSALDTRTAQSYFLFSFKNNEDAANLIDAIKKTIQEDNSKFDFLKLLQILENNNFPVNRNYDFNSINNSPTPLPISDFGRFSIDQDDFHWIRSQDGGEV